MGKKIDNGKWAQVVGSPDAWDKKNIQALVDTFNQTTFTLPVSDEPNAPTIKITGKEWARMGLEESRQRHQLELGNDYGVKSDKLEMRVMTSVPFPLRRKLMQGYPALFSDYKQQLWFAKNFPAFRVPRKI